MFPLNSQRFQLRKNVSPMWESIVDAVVTFKYSCSFSYFPLSICERNLKFLNAKNTCFFECYRKGIFSLYYRDLWQ